MNAERVSELSPDAWPYTGKEIDVLTHRACANRPGIAFSSEKTADLLAKLKKEQKRKFRICGGASAVNPVLRAHMADEITVSVIPVLHGI